MSGPSSLDLAQYFSLWLHGRDAHPTAKSEPYAKPSTAHSPHPPLPLLPCEAKKTEVAKHVLSEMFQNALEHEVSLIGGDANQAWNNGSLVEALRNVIQKTGKNITFQVVEPSKKSDCQVAFVLSYPESPPWAVRISKDPSRLTAADLGDRPSCGDAHFPLVSHTDNLNKPRRRSEAAMEVRKAKRKDKMKEQRSVEKNPVRGTATESEGQPARINLACPTSIASLSNIHTCLYVYTYFICICLCYM